MQLSDYNLFCIASNLNILKFCSVVSNAGPIIDDPYWTSRKNSLEQVELSSATNVSLMGKLNFNF